MYYGFRQRSDPEAPVTNRSYIGNRHMSPTCVALELGTPG
jgi:hypothetical protein